VKSRIHPSFTTFLNCWNCGINLGQSDFATVHDHASLLRPHKIAVAKVVDIGAITVASSEVLDALRAISHIFLRNKLRQQIAYSSSHWAVVARALPDELKLINMIENVSATYRTPIVNAASNLLSDWPNQFIQFCKESQITRSDFHDTESLMPLWMQECIQKHLSKQNRSVNSVDAALAIKELTAANGKPPTKSQIRRHLGWFGEKALRTISVKRTEATAEEWCKFDESVQHQLALSTLRSDCRAGFLRDLMVIALCARDSVSPKDIASLSQEDFLKAPSWREIETAVFSKWGITPSELKAKFYNSPVEVDLQRAVSKRLRELMRDLPFDLMKSPRVFSRFLFDRTFNDQVSSACSDMEVAVLQDVSAQLELPF
jgi:hypothetical protein